MKRHLLEEEWEPWEPQHKRLETAFNNLNLNHDDAPSDKMETVRNNPRIIVTADDLLDTDQHVEIDPNFIKIPKQIYSEYFDRPSQALIPYQRDESAMEE